MPTDTHSPSSPPHAVEEAIAAGIARVADRFERQLASDLPPVAALVEHVERYRGKMLRPRLTLLAALAAGPDPRAMIIPEEAVVCAAVCEMVHMATLVHDDVLDEAAVRRRGRTVNNLRGNEAAVILGDYLIAAAFHLCSQLDSQKTALLVGRVSMTLCAGELLQLHHRNDFSVDEATYFEIVGRKTAALIALAARLGAMSAGAAPDLIERFEAFGRGVGVAFQIQDDLLDLTADAGAIGKPVRQDLEKGKLTLPLIHHLAGVTPAERGVSLELLERACARSPAAPPEAAGSAREQLAARLATSGSTDFARREAERLVEEAKRQLAPLADSAAKQRLFDAADRAAARES